MNLMIVKKFFYKFYSGKDIKLKEIFMQVNSINKTNFQAEIIPSKALSYALEHAQEEAKIGTKNGLKHAQTFYNNLRTIEKDRRVDVFHVDGDSANFHPYIQFGKKLSLLRLYGFSPKDLAYSIMEEVNKLVEGRYLRDQISDEAKNVDLTKAFERWI